MTQHILSLVFHVLSPLFSGVSPSFTIALMRLTCPVFSLLCDCPDVPQVCVCVFKPCLFERFLSTWLKYCTLDASLTFVTFTIGARQLIIRPRRGPLLELIALKTRFAAFQEITSHTIAGFICSEALKMLCLSSNM